MTDSERALFGTRLRVLREERKLTQQQVGDYANINRSTYSYYESGRTIPHLPTLIMIANLFGLRTSKLIAALLTE